MKNVIEELFMKDFRSRAPIGLAVSAAAMSVVCALFVPYAYPWPSLAWAVLASAAAVWVAVSSSGPGPRMSEVISGLEAGEPSGQLATPKGDVVSTSVIS